MHIHRDTAAVVADPDVARLGDCHIDVVAVASQSLVDRVINNFIDQVVQTPGAG